MHFLRHSNLIILLGGRRLGDAPNQDISAEFIKETHVLNMRTLEWAILKYTGPQLPGIYNFTSCQTANEDIYVFGGT